MKPRRGDKMRSQLAKTERDQQYEVSLQRHQQYVHTDAPENVIQQNESPVELPEIINPITLVKIATHSEASEINKKYTEAHKWSQQLV